MFEINRMPQELICWIILVLIVNSITAIKSKYSFISIMNLESIGPKLCHHAPEFKNGKKKRKWRG